VALLVSLGLHAGLGFGLTHVPCPGGGGCSECAQVDGCAMEMDEDATDAVRLVAPSEPAPFRAVLIAVPAVPDSSNPGQSADGTSKSDHAVASDPALDTTNKLEKPRVAKAPGEGVWAAGSPGRTNGVDPRKSTTTFFQIEARGQTFVYVIDRSSSMGLHGALQSARQQLLASLEQLPETARFQVIIFNRTAEPLIPSRQYLMAATLENKRLAARRLEELVAEGGTDHLAALRRALGLRPDVIYFLTDADDLTSEHLRAAERLNTGRFTAIHTIELNTRNRDRTELPMHVLALENHGTYRAVALDGP
jgi:hypothetical protein